MVERGVVAGTNITIQMLKKTCEVEVGGESNLKNVYESKPLSYHTNMLMMPLSACTYYIKLVFTTAVSYNCKMSTEFMIIYYFMA